MVLVNVRVDDEAHWLVRNRFQRGQYLGRERRELIVDENNAVRADGGANVASRKATGALHHIDHVYSPGYFGDFELNFAPILFFLLCKRRYGGQQYQR